ncbi:thioesterase II family protein [Streptomyces asoensis]
MSDEQPVRLHCFAHSAGSVPAFGHWAAHTGPGVEVVPVALPGAGRRPGTSAHEALLADVLPLFTGPQPGPYVLYGHGLGALAALAVTRALHEAALPGPALLAVGACPPPRVPRELPDVAAATDAELLHVLSAEGAVPPASDEGILLRAVLPLLRADLELAQSLQQAARRPAPAGAPATALLVITAVGGPPEPPALADGRRQWTQGPVRTRTLPGRPFYVRGGRELPRLLGRACRVAARLVREPAPVG